MRWTNLKKKVLAGECVYGTMIRLARDPGALGLYAAAGFYFVFIDMEHGCYNIGNDGGSDPGRQIGRAGQHRPGSATRNFLHLASPRFRRGGNHGPDDVNRGGCAGHRPIQQMQPIGMRGYGSGSGMTDCISLKTADMMKDANENILVVAQIETREAIENIDAILATEGIDVGLIGPNDLSLSLKVLEQHNSEVLTNAIGKVVDSAMRLGKASGIHIGSVDAMKRWRARGMTVLACSSDVHFQYNAAKATLEEMRS